jgi:transketolase
MSGALPEDWRHALPDFAPDAKGIATRKASEVVLQAVAATLPELLGGSADLNPSTLTWLKGEGDFESPQETPADRQGAVGPAWDYSGRNLHFGVREHAMGAIANGIACHGGLVPYTATFLVFSDYMRPAIRLAALGGYPTVFVFTHDSVGVGEDGPTHQPVEQLMSLRLIPNLVVLRPADANETSAAWGVALDRRDGPTVLVLSRQSLPVLHRRSGGTADGVRRGGYVLREPSDSPEVILIASGSEVSLAVTAAERLSADGVHVRVVSMPSWELFEAQTSQYRDSVLSSNVTRRVAIEAGRTLGWTRYVGDRGRVIGLDRFGASAPGDRAFREFGITADAIVAAVKETQER